MSLRLPFLGINFLLVWLPGLSALWSTELRTLEALSPTQFTDEVLVDGQSDQGFLRMNSFVDLQQSGPLQLETLRLGGARSSDVGFFLEGIPLGSEALGPTDLREAFPAGLESIQILRGSYLPLSSYSQGQVHLRMRRDESRRLNLGYGSFHWRLVELEAENVAFSYQASENDFFVESDSGRTRQQGYGAKRIALRSRFEFQNLELIHQLTYTRAESGQGFGTETASPLLGAKGRLKDWRWTAWIAGRQQQLLIDGSSNWSLRAGQRIERIWILRPQHSLEMSFETRQDQLWNQDFESPFRSSSDLVLGWLWTPSSGNLIQSRLKTDWISDLNTKAWSLQPQVGGRHALNEAARFLWNISITSLAPDFYDLYTENQGEFFEFVPNPELKRETKLSADMGVEFQISEQLRWRQILKVSRTWDLIQKSVLIDEDLNRYQAQNSQGLASQQSLESQVNWTGERFHLKLQHRYLISLADGFRNPYTPEHQITLLPHFSLMDSWSLKLPLWIRSPITTRTDEGGQIGWQYDLGLESRLSWRNWEFQMQVFNLLRWKRRDNPFQALPEETWFQTQLRLQF
ncbi:MAG: hypothetical protein EA369_00810 [Bradymonadales bacterium]|nr:MAG: hypothetical protein EA369_00810 [Bradymonadales bacterium]